jgi:hypothetical protein
MGVDRHRPIVMPRFHNVEDAIDWATREVDRVCEDGRRTFQTRVLLEEDAGGEADWDAIDEILETNRAGCEDAKAELIALLRREWRRS